MRDYTGIDKKSPNERLEILTKYDELMGLGLYFAGADLMMGLIDLIRADQIIEEVKKLRGEEVKK